MWDIISVSLQAHNSDDDRPYFFRQDTQRPWPVLNRFKVHAPLFTWETEAWNANRRVTDQIMVDN